MGRKAGATRIRAALFSFALSVHTPSALAGGVIGDILKGAGRAVGIKPIEELGRNLDAEHKRFKDQNPVYRQAEENVSGFVRTPFSLACTANFETIVGAVRASCSRFASQSIGGAEAAVIEGAKQRLYGLGVTSPAELSGVSVRWCQGDFNGLGIAPAPNEIILNRVLLSAAPDDVALTLAHELHHLRQYRSMGAGPFKCNYSQQFLQCGGCQDERHAMERDAYRFEAWVAARMATAGGKPQPLPAGTRLATFSSLAGSGTFLDAAPPPAAARADAASRPQPLTRDAIRLARGTCTLDGRVNALDVAACIDDLEVLYLDLLKWMLEDQAKNDLEREIYYRELAQPDVDAACQILAHTVKSEGWKQTRVRLCKHGTRASIRELRDRVAGG